MQNLNNREEHQIHELENTMLLWCLFLPNWSIDLNKAQSKSQKTGLPWWRSGWESACQCRGHGFEPWSGRIPHATGQLSPEPQLLSLRVWSLCSATERPRQWEARAPRWRVVPTRRSWRKPSHRNEDPTQPKINKLIN